ncbi:hypothetical protein HN51_004856, partial [Arachis hypogaea]
MAATQLKRASSSLLPRASSSAAAACVASPHRTRYVFTRGGFVELSKKLSLPLSSTLDRYEGLVLSVGGNGRSYVLILEAGPLADPSQSKLYFARISTKVGFCR